VKDRLEVNNEDKELEYFKKMLLDLFSLSKFRPLQQQTRVSENNRLI
jgi:hypothetical protein